MPFGGLLTVALIGAGTSIAGGIVQSKAASKATKAQTDAGDKSLALQREIYNQQQANEAPWRNTGAAAITSLGGLLGLPAGAPGGGTGQLPAQGGGPQYDAPYTAAQANFDHYSPTGGYIGKDTPVSEQMSNPNVNVDASGYTAQQHGATPPYVTVKAPNGTSYQVPWDKKQEAVDNGGVVVG